MIRRLTTVTMAAVIAVAAGAPAAMAVPPNASIPLPADSPWHVPLDTTYFQDDTSDAGLQQGEPYACGSRSMWKTVWYRLTGAGGSVRISTNASYTTFDTVVAVYEATADGRPATQVACNDDVSTNNYRSDLTTALAAGRDYLVQIGGCFQCASSSGGTTPDSGNLSITFLANDARAAAETLAAGHVVTRSNWFAGLENGEISSCGGAAYGATTWFRFTSPAKGTATFVASGANTAISIYRGGEGTPIACDAPTTPGTLGARRTVDVGAGDYLLQVGGRDAGGGPALSTAINVSVEYAQDTDADDDGEADATDCAPNDASRRHGAKDIYDNGIDEDCNGRDFLDFDGDGHDKRPQGDDCDDRNPKIHPGQPDTRGNRIDENCNGKMEPGALRVSIDLKANRHSPGRLIFGRLRVDRVKRGYRISVKCKGGAGCPRRPLTKKIRRGRDFQSNYTFGQVLANGAHFDVAVTWPRRNMTGILKRFAVKHGKLRQSVCDLVPKTAAGRSFRRRC
jgi:hypothetical protein